MFSLFKRKPKIIVVLGQTATGKSDLAVEIAKKFNGEIISADSRQVYLGMDLGSGKITKEEMQSIPHHLLDVANPVDIFDVKKFQELGINAIEKILEKNKIPIVCGGTGFYIDSLVHQTKMSPVKPNKKLREELSEKTLTELQEIYRMKTSRIKFWIRSAYRRGIYRMTNKIDINNPVRVIRAIEIIDALGYIPRIKKYNTYNVLYIGLQLPKEELHKKIYKRIIRRLDQGMLNEGKKLVDSGVSHERLRSFGLEYKYMSKYILGEILYEEMIEQLYHAITQFAKRQKTWFKKNKKIHWFNPTQEKDVVYHLIDNFLK